MISRLSLLTMEKDRGLQRVSCSSYCKHSLAESKLPSLGLHCSPLLRTWPRCLASTIWMALGIVFPVLCAAYCMVEMSFWGQKLKQEKFRLDIRKTFCLQGQSRRGRGCQKLLCSLQPQRYSRPVCIKTWSNFT